MEVGRRKSLELTYAFVREVGLIPVGFSCRNDQFFGRRSGLHVVRSLWPLTVTVEPRRSRRGLWREGGDEKSSLGGLMKKENEIFGEGRKRKMRK